MREQIQPIPDRQPSTTRAVAWGALFFSLLAFCFSMATFFLTYKDGRLVHNLQELTGSLADQYARVRREEPATRILFEDRQPVDTAKISDRIGRVEAMIADGDDRAKYYLDNLSSDLTLLRDYAGDEGSGSWLGSAVETLNKVRDDLNRNAPAAAERLTTLADEIRRRSSGAGEDLGARAERLRRDALEFGEGLRRKGAEARESLGQLQEGAERLRDAGRALQPVLKRGEADAGDASLDALESTRPLRDPNTDAAPLDAEPEP